MNIYVEQAKRLMEAWSSTTKDGLSKETVKDIDAAALDLRRQLEQLEQSEQEILSQETLRAFFALVGMVSFYCPFIRLPAVIGFSNETAIDSDLEAVQKADNSLREESLNDENRDGPFPKFDDPLVGRIKEFLESVRDLQANKKFTGKEFALLSDIYTRWVCELIRNRLPVDLTDVPLGLLTISELEN